MESMPQFVSETVDKVAPDPVMKEMGTEICSKKYGDSGSFPALNDVDVIPESSDAGCYTESEWGDSEDSASACSLESDASSNAISGNSLVSDADSLPPSCEDKLIKKCPSGGSIVTFDEAVSKVNIEGDCKAADDKRRRGKRYQTEEQFDEEDTSINTVPRTTESRGKAWTDDKHCSYLNSIEATFVRSLYQHDYRTVDMSEQDQDCVESRPMEPGYLAYHAGGELFTSLQRGCYDQREYYRPHYIFASSTPAVFASPWIQHFSPRISPQTNVNGPQDVFAGHTSSTSGYGDGIHDSNHMYHGVDEEVMESVPELPDAHELPVWNNRHQSQLNTSSSASVRPDASIQAKKRACNLDPCTDVVYRPKKLKSTQQKLAETDLELEEQFVREQINQREGESRIEVRESVWRVDESSSLPKSICGEEHDRHGVGAQILHNMAPSQFAGSGRRSDGEELSAKKEVPNCSELEEDRNRRVGTDKHHDRDILLKQSADPARKYPTEISHECEISSQIVDTANAENLSARKDAFGYSGQHCAVIKTGFGVNVVEPAAVQSPASRLKIALDESLVKCQRDAGYDEHDECNFVAKISPRASRTYTWSLMGTRRPLLSGNVKEVREGETSAKEK